MATKSSEKLTPQTPENPPVRKHVLSFLNESMTIFGKKVNEDRAIISFQDGMKPVHRRSVWAAKSVASSSGKTAKTALLVGDVLGKFHPHGDASVAQAIGNMVTSEVPLFIGVGNWGTFIDPPAAMRYTNLKLSKYGQSFLENDYLKCVPYVSNYDGTLQEPLYLPALLPNVLLNPNTGIGVGLASNTPSYTPESLIPICIEIFKDPANAKKVLDSKYLAKNLEFNLSWGMKIASGQLKKLISFYEGETSSLKFYCPVVNSDFANRTIIVENYGPKITLETDKKKDKDKKKGEEKKSTGSSNVIPTIRGWNFVHSVNSDKLTFRIVLKKGITKPDFDKAIAKIENLMSVNLSFSLNVTERVWDTKTAIDNVLFHNWTVAEIIWNWCKFRMSLERKVIAYRIGVVESEINRINVLLLAHANLEFLFNALRKKFGTKTELRDHIAKGLKITQDDADIIVNLAYHRLSALDAADLQKQKRDAHDKLKDLKAQAKRPADNVAADLKEKLKNFRQSEHICKGQVQYVL